MFLVQRKEEEIPGLLFFPTAEPGADVMTTLRRISGRIGLEKTVDDERPRFRMTAGKTREAHHFPNGPAF